MTDKSSESVEMYVKRIAVLQASGGQAVPLSVLAADLSILPTSANEMCRRLAAEGLVDYRPYKGVILTPAGEILAREMLCRQRIWERFLVDILGFELDEAEETACQLEHATSDKLVNRLAEFLDFPTLSPRNEPIPCAYGAQVEPVVVSLTSLDAGQTGQINDITGDQTIQELLYSKGLFPGVRVMILAVKVGESILLEVAGEYISLAQRVADAINIIPTDFGLPAIQPDPAQSVANQDRKKQRAREKMVMQQVSKITLEQLPVGGQGIIVQIGGSKAAKRRMLDMGLVTGETITLKAVAPMGDPLEFVIKGYQLSLRKNEARNVVVERMDNGLPVE